jgi:mediator of RNA polymerase II transcription subunit 10
MVPLQVLADVDGARNPVQLTRERLERAAAENQFVNGKIAAVEVRTSNSARLSVYRAKKTTWPLSFTIHVNFNILSRMSEQSYRRMLDEALLQSFPDLAPYLQAQPAPEASAQDS